MGKSPVPVQENEKAPYRFPVVAFSREVFREEFLREARSMKGGIPEEKASRARSFRGPLSHLEIGIANPFLGLLKYPSGRSRSKAFLRRNLNRAPGIFDRGGMEKASLTTDGSSRGTLTSSEDIMLIRSTFWSTSSIRYV